MIFVISASLFVIVMGTAGIWFVQSRSSGIQYGTSFNVIKEANGDSYVLEGYTEFVESKSKAFSPHAVLVVGVAEGATLGGQKFDLGTIVVVDGDESKPVYRVATPSDRIALKTGVTVFDKSYPAGRFRVPPSGRLPTRYQSHEGEVKAVPFRVVDGKMVLGDDSTAKRNQTQKGGTEKKGGVAQWRGENVMDLSGSEVTGEFKGEKYHGKVGKGGLKFGSFGEVLFSGINSGKQVVENKPSKLWQSVSNSFTRCRILDSAGIKLLVDGDVETMNSESLFLAPGSVIENATINRQTIPLAVPASGTRYQLSFGETAEVDANGEIKSRTNRSR